MKIEYSAKEIAELILHDSTERGLTIGGKSYGFEFKATTDKKTKSVTFTIILDTGDTE